MTETLGQIGEKELLHRIEKYLGKSEKIIRIFSEDCAVIDSAGDYYHLFSMDVLFEGIHFQKEYMPAYYIGRKGLKVNVSDISAMGGRPLYYMVSIGAPEGTSWNLIEEIYDGMYSVGREADLLLIGGNVSEAPMLFLDIMVIGRVRKDRAIMRNNAKNGDAIFITGRLGAAAEGLKLLQDGFRFLGQGGESLIIPGQYRESNYVKEAILAQMDPPLINELAQKIAKQRGVHAMIDLSDGLASDLLELCKESHVGASIDIANVPIDPSVLYWERKRNSDPVVVALEGGEDYHLLFTVSAKERKRFLEAAKQFEAELFEIGRVVDRSEGVFAISERGKKVPIKKGFEHFQ